MIGQQQFIKLRDGVELFCHAREIGASKSLVALHGIGEHLGRHQYLTDVLGHNHNIFQFDLRGHGRSSGERADISDFSLYMEDLTEVIEFLQKEYRLKEFCLFGHSMGALIASAWIQSYASEKNYPHKIFLSAPPVSLAGPLGTFVRLAPHKAIDLLANMPIGAKLGGMVDLKLLSHDPRISDQYKADPLNCLKLHTRLLTGLASTAKSVFSKPLYAKSPLFVAVGLEDKIVHVPSVEEYFSFVEKEAHLRIIDGAYHEMHNEIEKYRQIYFNFLKSSLS